MKKNLLNKLWLRVGMIVAIMTTALSGTVWAEEVTDVIDRSATSSDIGSTANNQWKTFTVTGSSSGVTYNIRSMGTTGSSTDALRWNSNGWLYMSTTYSGYKLKSVSITTSANKNIGIYASNTVYSEAPSGTALSTLAATSSGTTYTFTSDYTYLALKGTASSTLITSITVVWETSGSTPTETVATPTFSPAGGTYTSAQNVTISTETSGATIYYTTDGNTPTTSSSVYSSALTISETTTVKAMAVKEGMNNSAVASATYTINLPYSGPDYVRVSSLDYLTNGAKVVIAARFNTSQTNGYYAMTATTSGKPEGVTFGSETSSNGEILPAKIVDSESTYCWTVGVTENGYTFTNANNDVLGYSSGTDFAKNNNTDWVIVRATAGSSAMVAGYEGFYITNKNNSGRGIAFNGSAYGSYATSNNNDNKYNFYLDIFVQGATPSVDPAITANNVNITYDATSGSITYTINNPVSGGVLTAATNDSWLTLGTVGETVPFTCSANNTIAERTATVTLTYTYNTNETVTKTITVTQAGNPNAVDNISDITEVGVSYRVRGTVVATNARGFIIGDGTDYVYTYLNAAPTQAIGDKVTVSGTTGTYGHIIQFTNSATVAEATTSNYDNTPAVSVITGVPDYSEGYHLSTYLKFEGTLSVSNNVNLINVGGTDIQISYPTTAQTTALAALNGKTVSVKGYFSGINSSDRFTVMLESVEEVTTPVLSVTPAETIVAFEGESGTLDVTATNFSLEDVESSSIQYFEYDGSEYTSSSKPAWLTIGYDNANAVINYTVAANAGEARSAYFKLVLGYDEDYIYSDMITINQEAYVTPPTGDQYALFTGTLVEGDYIIYYDGNAMNTTVTNDRLQYEEVTPVSDIITTDDAAIVWHIAPSGNYWTIYNAAAEAYAAGTGVKNKAQMLADGTDDKALWTVTGTETYEFVNKANAAASVNANLRNNGTYGFACYATGTGGALSLYKKVYAPETITLNTSGYATFASTSAVDFTEAETNGYSAWAVTGVNGTEISFQQITGVVEAGTGVLLKGEPSATISPVYVESGDAVTGNKLVGITSATAIEANQYYGLSGSQFKKVKAGTVKAGKALLPAKVVNDGTEVKTLTFVFEEDPTGIDNLNANVNANEGAIYNLSGQMVNGKLPKGIYIVNGKKILK